MSKDKKEAGQAVEVDALVSPGKIEGYKDIVAEKLDEMADICEYWKKNREKGRTPNAIRSALVILADELVMIRAAEQIPPELLDKFRTKIEG